jgi:undecaprenyl-phosphate 4-deoxy-4-formamido-L-arabinose transferase
VSIVVPVYNGAASLTPLVERLARALPATARDWEVILVNDASADASWSVIQALAERHAWVRGIDLRRNAGQHNATLCGVHHARFARVVTMDDDLEHPPESVAALLGALDAGHDVAYGTAPPPRRGWLRGVGRALMRPLLLRELGTDGVHGASAFRAFRTELRDAFPPRPGPAVILDLLLARATRRIAYVEVEYGERHGGASSYSVPRLVGTSRAPLHAAGAASCVLAVLLGLWVANEFPNDPETGLALTALLLAAQVAFVALYTLGPSVGDPDEAPYAVRARIGAHE